MGMPDDLKMGMTLPGPEGGVLLDWNWSPDSEGDSIIALVVDTGQTLPFCFTVLHIFTTHPLTRYDHPERYDSLRDATIMFEHVTG